MHENNLYAVILPDHVIRNSDWNVQKTHFLKTHSRALQQDLTKCLDDVNNECTSRIAVSEILSDHPSFNFQVRHMRVSMSQSAWHVIHTPRVLVLKYSTRNLLTRTIVFWNTRPWDIPDSGVIPWALKR